MLKKHNRLSKNYQFRYVYKHGLSSAAKQLTLVYTSTKARENRYGISVSNKIGKAVLRNRIKRLIREALRQMLSKIKKGYNCVIVAGNGYNFSYETALAEISAALYYVFDKAKLLSQGSKNLTE